MVMVQQGPRVLGDVKLNLICQTILIHNFRTYYSAITVDSRKKVLYVEERSSRITKGLRLPVETGDIDAMLFYLAWQ